MTTNCESPAVLVAAWMIILTILLAALMMRFL